MPMLSKTLEFENMNVSFNYTTKELSIDHKLGKITLNQRDMSDLKEALESIGQQVPRR